MAKLTAKELDKLKDNANKECNNCIKVGMSTCGLAAGSEEVYKALSEEVKKHKLNITVTKCGCIGMCFAEPLAEVRVEGMPAVLYGNVDKKVAKQIVEQHLVNKKILDNHIFDMNT